MTAAMSQFVKVIPWLKPTTEILRIHVYERIHKGDPITLNPQLLEGHLPFRDIHEITTC